MKKIKIAALGIALIILSPFLVLFTIILYHRRINKPKDLFKIFDNDITKTDPNKSKIRQKIGFVYNYNKKKKVK